MNSTDSLLNRRREKCRLAVSSGIHASVHQGGLVLLHGGKGKGSIFTANRIGAQIWEGIASGETPNEIARRLSGTYGVSHSEVEQHMDAFLGDLLNHGILLRKPEYEEAVCMCG